MRWGDRLAAAHADWRAGRAPIEHVLEACESRVRLSARRFFPPRHMLHDDALQVGRIAAWRAVLDWGGLFPLGAHVNTRIKARVIDLRRSHANRPVSTEGAIDLEAFAWPVHEDGTAGLPPGLVARLKRRHRRAIEARLAEPDADYERLGQLMGVRANAAKTYLMEAYRAIRRNAARVA